MTFAAILPHLRNGERIRRRGWNGCLLRNGEILVREWMHNGCMKHETWELFRAYEDDATDWELVDSVTAGPHVCAGSCSDAIEAQATVSRLTREVETLQSAIRSYAKELEEARRCCKTCGGDGRFRP